MTTLCDAHNHLHDVRFLAELPGILSTMHDAGITHCVVNGTCEGDWGHVMALARANPRMILPSIGLHPWKVSTRSDNWLEKMTSTVIRESGRVFIGECGLDRWMHKPNIEEQKKVFISQLALASEYNLPISIHCLKAWGTLLEILKTHHRPQRGFLLHSYGGSPELVPELAALGGYFSFSGYFLREEKKKVHEAFRRIPPDRVMVETDAPDMLPPEPYRKYSLATSATHSLNHPANLLSVVEGLATILEIRESHLRSLVSENFHSFFPVELS
jgi:TatD DNase family protein